MVKDITVFLEEHEALKAEVKRLKRENRRLRGVIRESRNLDYLTVRQFAEKSNEHFTTGKLANLSRRCREYCETHGIKIANENVDARHNLRPSFPLSVIKTCHEEEANRP